MSTLVKTYPNGARIFSSGTEEPWTVERPEGGRADFWSWEAAEAFATRPTRRRPAPKDVRERARRAGAYADEVYERFRGVERMIERGKRFGGYETQGYKQSLVEDTLETMAADEVAIDAFLEAGQERLAKKYIARLKKDREVYLPAYERWAYTAPGNESLVYLLRHYVDRIGPEREVPIAPRWQSGIRALTRNANASLFISPQGSYRYVAFDGENPVSVVQIMSRDGREGVIANVYTTPKYRRHGWATRLLDIARRRFAIIHHSPDLSPAGAAWADQQGAPRPPAWSTRKR